jgi:DNA invertase Pin-like site-specific DNA recombinase
MAATAYSYVRFSSRDQQAGDSGARQGAEAERYARENGLILDTTYKDSGVSGFRGKNAASGAFSRFVVAVTEGRIPAGSYLLVEAFDRFTRDEGINAAALLKTLLDHDITVVTLEDRQVYTHENLRSGRASLIVAVAKMESAASYSERLSRRMKSAWSAKRAQVPKKKLTKTCRGWLLLKPCRTEFQVLEKKAEIVRLMFYLYIHHMGLEALVQYLNNEGVPTFDSERRKANGWSIRTVARILFGRAVIGEFEPHTVAQVRSATTGKLVRRDIPTGEIERDYYPAIIDRATWERAQAKRARSQGTGGPRSHMTNMFSGLMTCLHCGSRLVTLAKGADARATRRKIRADYHAWREGRYFVCTAAHRRLRGADGAPRCHHRDHMPLAPFEDAVLDGLAGLLVDNRPPHNPRLVGLQEEIDRSAREIDVVSANLDDVISRHGRDPEIARSIERIKARLATQRSRKAELERELAEKRGAVPVGDVVETVRRLRQDVLAKEHNVRQQARMQVAEAMKQIVDEILVNTVEDAAIVRFGNVHEFYVVSDRVYATEAADLPDIISYFRYATPGSPEMSRFQTVLERMGVEHSPDKAAGTSWASPSLFRSRFYIPGAPEPPLPSAGEEVGSRLPDGRVGAAIIRLLTRRFEREFRDVGGNLRQPCQDSAASRTEQAGLRRALQAGKKALIWLEGAVASK